MNNFSNVRTVRTYWMLTKPGIILGNLITAAAGFLLASKGELSFGLFLATLIGLYLVIGSGCVFNNYIDREMDQKMVRTQNRPLAKGTISGQRACFFAAALGLLGTLILTCLTNVLTALLALLGFLIYVFVYSFVKYRTVYGTLIGSVAGAIPPLVGYSAVTERLDSGAWIFFSMMVVWQMPHFFAIAIYRLDDYTRATIPILPVIKGIPRAKLHMLLYVSAFIPVSCSLSFTHTGYAYLTAAVLLGLMWLKLSIQGLKREDHKVWAREMFIFSLIVIIVLCLVVPFSVL